MNKIEQIQKIINRCDNLFQETMFILDNSEKELKEIKQSIKESYDFLINQINQDGDHNNYSDSDLTESDIDNRAKERLEERLEDFINYEDFDKDYFIKYIWTEL